MNAPLYSWSRFALRTAAGSAGVQACPTKLSFVITKRCNSRCTYCDIWKVKDTPGGLDNELSLDEVKALAAANPFLQWIDFTGGEPTDRPDFPQVVQAFAAACPDLLLTHFPTNGIATKRIVEMVTEIRRTVRKRLVVSVSIDGPPELNDRLRGIRNDFGHAVDTYASLRRLLGPGNVFIGMTLHAHTGSCGRSTSEVVGQTFSAINEALRARAEGPFGWGELHLNIPHFSPHFYGNTSSQAKDGFGGPAHRAEIRDALQMASAQPRRNRWSPMGIIERIYRAEAGRYLAEGRTSIRCAALLSTVYLSEKGEVYPCTIWDRPLGNVRTTAYALMPIIADARRNGIRKTITDQKCPNCWTPCEAYSAIAASPARSLLALSRPE